MLRKHAAEGVGRHDVTANGVGGLAQFLSVIESALVAVNPKAEDVPHVGVGLHGADQHHVVQRGKGGELVAIPGAGVLGDAEAAQAQPFGFKDELVGRQAGVGAALGSMDVQVKEASHKPNQCMRSGLWRQRAGPLQSSKPPPSFPPCINLSLRAKRGNPASHRHYRPHRHSRESGNPENPTVQQ